MKPKFSFPALSFALLFSFTAIAQDAPGSGLIPKDPNVAPYQFDAGRFPNLYSTITGKQQDQSVNEYIRQFQQSAVAEMYRAGVPASITMAQAVIESGAGTSELARVAKNHFGIKKGMNWTGPVYYVKDDDYVNGTLVPSPFRVYNSAQESYSDHSNFLRNGRRYNFLFNLNPKDYKGWANGLVASGYATDQRYGDMLVSTVELYQLYSLDGSSAPEGKQGGNGNRPDAPEPVLVASDQVQNINGLKAIVANSGLTLEAVAGRYDIRLQKLLAYNDQTGPVNYALPAGAIVFLEEKSKSWHGDNKYHTVKPGETMFAISQKYGIRLDKLYSKNNMQEGTQPAVGEQVILRRGWFQGWKTPKLRDPSLDVIPQTAPVNPPAYPNNPNGSGSNSGYPSANPNGSGSASGYPSTNPNGSGANTGYPGTNPNGSGQTYPGGAQNNGNNPPRPTPAGTPNSDGTLPIDITPEGFDASNPNKPTNPYNQSTGMDSRPTVNDDQPVNRPPVYTPPVDNTPVYRPPVTRPSAPAPSNNPSLYTVQPHETLYGIARRYGLTVDQLKRMNNLADNGIKIGQQLKVR